MQSGVPKYGYVIYSVLYPTFLTFSPILETSPVSTFDPDSTTLSPDFSPFRFNVPRGTFKLILIQRDFITPIYKVSRFRGKMGNGKIEFRGERREGISFLLFLTPAFSYSPVPYPCIPTYHHSLVPVCHPRILLHHVHSFPLSSFHSLTVRLISALTRSVSDINIFI